MSSTFNEAAIRLRPSWGYAVPRSFVAFAVGLVVAILMHALVVPAVGPYYGKILIDIGINIILAASLNLVNGFTGQFSIGHAGFMAVGGYVAAATTYYFSLGKFGTTLPLEGLSGDMLFLFACVLGGLVAAVLGLIVGLPSLRLRGDYLAIVTLGFGEILRVLLQRTDDVLTSQDEVMQHSVFGLLGKLGGSLGFTGVPFYTSTLWVYVFVAVTLIVSYRLKESTHGRAFLSIRENEIAAEAMGINTTKYKVQAFVLAAFFAGIAGALFAHLVGVTLNPKELGFQKSFDIIIMVVLGGMGSISGAVVAAIILTILPEALRAFADYRMILYALALILMMVLRPQGLFGLRELWEVGPWRKKTPKLGGVT